MMLLTIRRICAVLRLLMAEIFKNTGIHNVTSNQGTTITKTGGPLVSKHYINTYAEKSVKSEVNKRGWIQYQSHMVFLASNELKPLSLKNSSITFLRSFFGLAL
jgi:hypothetical protein